MDTSSRPEHVSSDPWFHDGELAAQARWRTTERWTAARREQLLWRHIPDELVERINAAPFFFLATSDRTGTCDCSFKGGGVGTLRILDPFHLAFGDIDGNGAFMSIGNILQNPHVGILLIDFATGERLRINGEASVHDDGQLLALFPGRSRVILVKVQEVVPNCAKHIPRLHFPEEAS